MYTSRINRIIALYEEKNIKVKKGLSSRQLELAQEYYNVIFPPDLKELLGAINPTQSFYDWSNFSEDNIQLLNERLALPVKGVLFDVENNDFWLNSWSNKPSTLDDRLLFASKQMETTPKLIPIMGHRYISTEPNEVDNPVFSVSQTDIIFFGENLWDYFEVEFGKKQHSDIECSFIKKISFWHDLIV